MSRTVESIQADIDAVKSARLKLVTGALKVEVRYADKSVKYAATDLTLIDSVLRELDAELKAASAGKTARRHGYVRPY